MIVWHNHHMWPQHAIGPAPKDNILKCNIAMHAFMHHQRWIKFGEWEDKIAWQTLTGQITRAEAIKQATSETQKRLVKEGKHPFLNKEKASERNIKRIKAGTHNFCNSIFQSQMAQIQYDNGTHPFLKHNMKIYTCNYCQKEILGIANYTRWHGERCKNKNGISTLN